LIAKTHAGGAQADAGAVPVPLKLTTWGLLLVLSLIVTEPARRPVVVGVKVTSIVHVALDATEPPV